MLGLDPGIHDFLAEAGRGWPGQAWTGPAMTLGATITVSHYDDSPALAP